MSKYFMFDIITFGSATKDIILKPKKLTALKYTKEAVVGGEVCFPVGSKIDVEEIMFNSGGGGTNTAATFALQGFKTAFCGVVGKDLPGQEILKELKELKVNTSLASKTNKKPTNHSVVILNNDQDRTILAYRGASELMDKNDVPWKKLKTRWIYLAPLTGLLCEAFEALVDFAKNNNIKVAVNPSIAQMSLKNFSEIAKKINVLILNQEEASFLTKMPIYRKKETTAPSKEGAGPSTQIEDLSALVFKKIDEICPGIAVMTKGGEGVVVSDGKYIYRAKPNPDRKIVDTTGAGDSFASGFISDFIRTNGDIEKAIQLGLANSAGCLSEIGAKNGLLKKGEPFERVKVEKSLCDNDVCIVK